MELELGLKITKPRDDDDHCIVSELRIAKDRAGPVFLSRETHAMFILTAHLKGYKRNNIEIKISEDGREISIGGEKPIQEMLMVGWVMMKNQVEMLGFKKVFKIPNGVILDQINAKYNEDESVLKIVMPKVVKGIHGVQIEEVKEEEFRESSKKAFKIGENESVLEKEEELSNKKFLEAAKGNIIIETSQKEIERPRFEIRDEFEETRNLELGQSKEDHHIPKNIGETSQEALKESIIQIQPLADRDNVVLTREVEGTKEKEIETDDRDEEGIGINKEELEASMETTIEGGKFESVLATTIGINGDEIVKKTEVPKFETKDRDRESVVGEEISKEGVKAIETTMKEQVPTAVTLLGESENVLNKIVEFSGEDMNEETKQKETEEPKFQIEDRDKEGVVREEISKEGVEVIETIMKEQVPKAPILLQEYEEEQVPKTPFLLEESEKEQVPKVPILLGESENVFAKAIGFIGKDMNGKIEQKEIEEPKFGIEYRYKEKMGENISNEGFATMKGEQEIFERAKPKEIEEPKFATKDKDKEKVREEISMKRFEVEEESRSVVKSMEGGEERIEVPKQRDEEPKFESVKEEASKIPKSAKAKVEEIEETEGIKEAMAKRESQEVVGFVKNIEGEEPQQMNGEARKVIKKDYTKEAEQKGIEENIIKKVFEVLGTIITEFPKNMMETKAKREREVKVKGEVVIKMHDEAKECFQKDIIEERGHMEIGQPSIGFKDSDKGRFHIKETLKVAKKEETKAIKKDFAKIEPSMEKVKGKNNEKVQVEAYGGFHKDKMEKNHKEIEEPKVGTYHKDQQCIQEELPMQVEGSMANKKEGPKDIEMKKMKEAQKKGEEKQVVADDESIVKEKIQETKSMCKKKQITKALQQVPEEKDPKALEKGTLEREESRQSTQQLKVEEKDKACEDYKTSKVTLEIEKHQASQRVKDEKPRTRKEVQHVAESLQKALEKQHPKNSKEVVERGQEPFEAKPTYPIVTNEFEPKNDIEQPKLKMLPPQKVEMQSEEPLKYEKKSMKLKFPKAKKHVPEAKEEEEEYKVAKQSEVESSSSTQLSMVKEQGKLDKGTDQQKFKVDILESSERRTSLQEKKKEALQPDILADQSLDKKEFLKTLTEDKGQQYMPEHFDERGFESKKVAEEEKLDKKDLAKRVPWKSKETMIVEREYDKKLEVQGMSPKLEGGDEQINESKQIVKEFKEALDDSEIKKSHKELVLRQTMEIDSEERSPKIRARQQKRKREIPFHASEVSDLEAEVKSPKASATHSEATSIEFRNDKLKDEVDKSQRKKQSSPSSKEPCELAKPTIKLHVPKVEIVPQLQEVKESIYPTEGTKASKVITNEVDKPSVEKSKVEEKDKTNECCKGAHLELHELEKQENDLDFQESIERRFDIKVEKIRSSQEEEGFIEHEIEEADEQDEVEVENTQELEVLEDIDAEERKDKKKVRAPLVIAGSAFLVSLIVFFVHHRRVGKR